MSQRRRGLCNETLKLAIDNVMGHTFMTSEPHFSRLSKTQISAKPALVIHLFSSHFSRISLYQAYVRLIHACHNGPRYNHANEMFKHLKQF